MITESNSMPKNEYIEDKETMLLYIKDYLVDEIARLKRKCIRYEKRLDYIWADDTIYKLYKRIEHLEEVIERGGKVYDDK